MTKWLLVVAAFLLFVVFPLSAPAAEREIVNPQGDSITLLDTPCTSTAGALVQLIDEARKLCKAAVIYWQGKQYDACYAEFDGYVFLVDEKGGQGTIVEKLFQPKHKL